MLGSCQALGGQKVPEGDRALPAAGGKRSWYARQHQNTRGPWLSCDNPVSFPLLSTYLISWLRVMPLCSKARVLNRAPPLPAVRLHFALTFAIGFDGRHQIRMNFYFISNEL